MLIISVMGKSLDDQGRAEPELIDRVETGVRMMKEMNADYIIPTGADPVGAGVTEAGVMADLMKKKGISEEKIILEDEAHSTVENAINVVQIIRNRLSGEEVRLVLVTSAYHIPLTAWCFRNCSLIMSMIQCCKIT